MIPRRVQLSRKKGWKMPRNTVRVSRPSLWGNPFPVTSTCTQEQAVELFRDYLQQTSVGIFTCFAAQKLLRGKNLACWCKPGTPCHADVLLKIANAP